MARTGTHQDRARTREIPPKLLEAYHRIRDGERSAIRTRTAREVLGASVIRVFAPGTKPPLIEQLESVDVDALPGLADETAFREWFVAELNALARTIKHRNPNRPSIYPGYQWGHATKILSIYCRDMVLRTRYFDEREAQRLVPWLYVPLDGMVIRKLHACGVVLPFRQIREIDTERKFFDTQDLLGAAASLRLPPSFDNHRGNLRWCYPAGSHPPTPHISMFCAGGQRGR